MSGRISDNQPPIQSGFSTSRSTTSQPPQLNTQLSDTVNTFGANFDALRLSQSPSAAGLQTPAFIPSSSKILPSLLTTEEVLAAFKDTDEIVVSGIRLPVKQLLTASSIVCRMVGMLKMSSNPLQDMQENLQSSADSVDSFRALPILAQYLVKPGNLRLLDNNIDAIIDLYTLSTFLNMPQLAADLLTYIQDNKRYLNLLELIKNANQRIDSESHDIQHLCIQLLIDLDKDRAPADIFNNPDIVPHLPYMTALNLRSCSLQYIDFRRFPSLESIDLLKMRNMTLDQIYQLPPTLRRLTFEYELFPGFDPAHFSYLESLELMSKDRVINAAEHLHLVSDFTAPNCLTPDKIRHLPSTLRTLSLGHANVTGIDFKQFPHLQSLDLGLTNVTLDQLFNLPPSLNTLVLPYDPPDVDYSIETYRQLFEQYPLLNMIRLGERGMFLSREQISFPIEVDS